MKCFIFVLDFTQSRPIEVSDSVESRQSRPARVSDCFVFGISDSASTHSGSPCVSPGNLGPAGLVVALC
jgi:hypothetical protein